jgi:hypothetical protein
LSHRCEGFAEVVGRSRRAERRRRREKAIRPWRVPKDGKGVMKKDRKGAMILKTIL